jgi:hypothetical protein
LHRHLSDEVVLVAANVRLDGNTMSRGQHLVDGTEVKLLYLGKDFNP